MAWKNAIQYQLLQLMRPIGIYFGLLIVLNALISFFSGDSSFTSATFMFLCIISLLGFGSRLKFFLQNGVSRLTLLISDIARILMMSVACVGLHAILEFVFFQKLQTHMIFSIFYSPEKTIENLLWWLCLYVFVCSVGNTLANGLYRLHIAWRLLFWVFAPVAIVIALLLQGQAIGKALLWCLGLWGVDTLSGLSILSEIVTDTPISQGLGGNAYMAMGSFLVGALVCWGLQYVVVRRIVVRED